MNQEFYANLDNAYQEIERLFNLFRKDFPEKLLGDLDNRRYTPIRVPDTWSPALVKGFFRFYNSRIAICLGNGYVVKIRPWGNKDTSYAALRPMQNKNMNYIEEENLNVLRKFGFTKENGFWVPEHKIVGLSLEDGRIKIDQEGYGTTIAEDLSEGGAYDVVGIEERLFTSLDNGEEFCQEYERHISALLELYHDPRIKPSINRHGTPGNPTESISRMLLARIKNNRGEIVIGDLDNLVFDEI